MPSFPVSSQKAFTSFFTRAFNVVGLNLVATAIESLRPVAPANITTVNANISNNATTMYLMSNASAQTLTVPANTSAIAIGTVITVVVLGVGQVTIAAENGSVTINKTAATLKSSARYGVIRLIKTSTATFIAEGALAAS
jgi:hypothetical protein